MLNFLIKQGLTSIPNYTLEEQMEMIKDNIYNISSIPNPHEEICLKAVRHDADILRYLPQESQTDKVCLEAIKTNGLKIKYLPEEKKTKEIYIEAVKNNGYAIQYISEDKRTEEICLEAVKQNPASIIFIKKENLTEEIFLEAIKYEKKLNTIKSKEEIIEYIALKEIKKNPTIVEYLQKDNFTENVCLEVINKRAHLIKYIPKDKLTEELCLKAINKNKTAITAIPKDVLTDKICVYAFLRRYDLIEKKYIRNALERMKETDEILNNIVFYAFFNEKEIRQLFNKDKYEFIDINLKSLEYLKDYILNHNKHIHFVTSTDMYFELLQEIALSNNELIIMDKNKKITNAYKKLANRIIELE